MARSEAPQYAMYLDIGSTRHKVGLVDQKLLSPFPIISEDMTRHVIFDTFTNKDNQRITIKWLDGNAYLRNATRMASDLLLKDKSPDISLFASTGFTNNLAVSYTDHNGVIRRKIILDDPSMETILTSKQMEILSSFIPDFKSLKVSTSLMKMLTLKNHSDLVRYLFNKDAAFKDLRFSTALGLLNEIMSAGEVEGIPPGDLKGFAGTTGKTIPEVYQLLFELGVKPDQLKFLDSATTSITLFPPDAQTLRKIALFQITDFEANTQTVSTLINQGLIDPLAIMLELDTVGKVFWRPNNEQLPPDTRKMGEFMYQIQRLTAGVNASILRHLVTTLIDLDNPRPYYQIIEDLLAEGLDESENPYWFFPEASASKPTGRLFKITGGKLWELDSSVTSLKYRGSENRSEIGKMVRGIIKGVFFGLRQKTEIALNHEQKTSGIIYAYGGLVHKHPHLTHYHEPWRIFLKQCFNPHDVYHVDLANAGQAAVLIGNKTIFQINPNVSLEKERIQNSLDRSKEFNEWKKMKKRVFATTN